MARGVTTNPALDAWRARAVRECLLPSGMEVKVKVPDTEVLVRGDALPGELIDIARKHVAVGVNADTATTEELLQYVEMTRHIAAMAVKAIKTDEGWQDVELTVDDLDGIDPEDVQALRMIALRRSTAAIVTAQSRALLAAADAADAMSREAVAAAEREAGGTVDGYADFRPDGPGALAGPDGEDVRAEPVPDVPRAD